MKGFVQIFAKFFQLTLDFDEFTKAVSGCIAIFCFENEVSFLVVDIGAQMIIATF